LTLRGATALTVYYTVDTFFLIILGEYIMQDLQKLIYEFANEIADEGTTKHDEHCMLLESFVGYLEDNKLITINK
jgi:hypothetical protein